MCVPSVGTSSYMPLVPYSVPRVLPARGPLLSLSPGTPPIGTPGTCYLYALYWYPGGRALPLRVSTLWHLLVTLGYPLAPTLGALVGYPPSTSTWALSCPLP